MEREKIEKIVREFLIEEIEVDEALIKPEALLKNDLGIDSLDFVDIVVIVEHHFGFKMKAEDIAEVKTLSEFCDYIEIKMKNK